MNYGSDPEATPLRLRLGPRADHYVPMVEHTLDAEDTIDVVGEAPSASFDEITPEPIEEPAPPAAPQPETPIRAWSDQLDSAIEQTGRRVDQWMSDQQSRLVAHVDLLLAQLKEKRHQEIARLEAWKAVERGRVEQELAQEKERFSEKLMNELVAFEEQLGLRLKEQEERLSRWWDEAEQMMDQRFAALDEGRPETN